MKTIAIIIVALAMTSCTKYKLHFGKACTPDHSEWSYVWIKEKGEVNISKENCNALSLPSSSSDPRGLKMRGFPTKTKK